MKTRTILIGWLAFVIIALSSIAGWVYKIDPYFHYHKPDIDGYFYTLNEQEQRSQNDGISKHFDYDALITGTSMTENFKTSEMNEIFGVNAVKVPYSGGTYKEMNDNLKVALEYNPNLKTILRGLDMSMFFDESSRMREELGTYPTYLYDDNPLNDIKYLLNKDVVFNRAYQMAADKDAENFEPGITSFDDYSRWQSYCVFGVNTVCPDEITVPNSKKAVHLTDAEKAVIKENIDRNVTAVTDQYPDAAFYYFFTPYSAVWWKYLVDDGTIYRQIEAEEYIIELILEHPNIRLYSFNNRTDITTDLNHYKDSAHYAEWVNSLMLKWMHDGKYLLTKDNYKSYLKKEFDFYSKFDYESLNLQEDYENDFYAAALLNEELNGVKPINLLSSDNKLAELSNAAKFQDEDSIGVRCKGRLQREPGSETAAWDYLINSEYIGIKIPIQSVENYKYIVFDGKKKSDNGQPTVYAYNNQDKKVAEFAMDYWNIDNEWHQYVMDITDLKGDITLIFNGGYLDNTGSSESTYLFRDITLY